MSDMSEQAELLRQTQARLQQLEGEQRRGAAANAALFDALPAHVAMLDAQGTIVAVNKAWRDFAQANGGCSPEFGVGQNYLGLCDQVEGAALDEASGAAACIRSALAGAALPSVMEYPCHSASRQRWYRMTASALPADPQTGSASGALVMHTDISERRHAEAAARQTGDLLQAVADSTSVHIFVKDLQSRYLLCNQATARFLGVPAEQLLGRDSSGVLAPEDAQAMAELDRRVFETGLAHTSEYSLTSAGQTRTFLSTKTPYRDRDGRMIGLICLARDITERKQEEQEREHERQLLRTLIDAMPDVMYAMNAQARLVICNPAATATCGAAAAQDVLGKTALEIFAGEEAQRRHADNLQVLAGHAVVNREMRGAERPGVPSWSLITKLPLRDAQGEIVGLVGIHRDITEQKHAQAQAQHLADRLGMTLEKLQTEHVRLLAAQAVAKIGNWSADFASGAVEWSRELHRILGTDPRQTRPAFDVYIYRVHPDERAAARQVLAHSFMQGVGGTREQRLLLPGGAGKVVEERWQVFCDEQGKAVRAIGTTQDITERKQAEWALRQSQALFGMVVRLARIGAWAVDLAQDLVIWSDEVCAIHEVPAGTMPSIEQSVAYYTPEWAGTVSAATAACADHGTPFDLEAEIVTAQGRRIWVRVIGESIRDEHGVTRRVQGAIQDLSERKQAEHEMRQLALRLTRTLESITDKFYTVDRDWSLTFVNANAAQRAGQRREDLIGRVLWDAFADLQGTEFESAFRRAMSEGTAIQIDAPLEARGSWFRAHAYPSEEGLAVHMRDITQSKRDQDALRDLNTDLEARVVVRTAELDLAREAAEQANRAKSIFLATMSHEIRTPMNGVMGMIDVLHQTSLKGYQVEMVDLIRDSADTLLAIIDDILDFSKIEAGKLHIEREPMQLADVVEKVCAMLDHTAVKNGVGLSLFVDPAIPQWVAGDETRVRQVIVNLCGNAIKFSRDSAPGGQVSVRVVRVESQAAEVTVDLSVADNGIGMDEATVAQLFTPFSQADGSTTRRFGGTGLGLAITGSLVRMMDGRISVRSAPGQGSTFGVRLSFAPVAKADHPPGANPGAADAAGLHCRIVGGEQPLAADLGAYLTDAGASVAFSPDLAAAAAAPPTAGLVVWMILPGQAVPEPPGLRALAPAGPQAETRFVVLGRGARRRPRLEAPDLVRIDADALLRRTLVKVLALAAGRLQEPAAGHERPPAGSPAPALTRQNARAQGRLILVAEDNETNRAVILRQIELVGCAADVAVDGRQALQAWRSGDYALLLTDLHMPEMDGYALAAAIRAEEAGGRRMPILALTANALRDEELRCLAAGMDAYLTKPIRLPQLRAAIDAWLAPPPPMPPVDLQVLKALVGDDPPVIADVLRAFRTSAAGLSLALHEGLAASSTQAVADAAHKLKSGARSIGAARLAETCAAVEQAGQGRAGTTLEPLVLRLQAELAAVAEYLDRDGAMP